MRLRKSVTYNIAPDTEGWCNDMTITFEDEEKGIGATYSLHHWHASVEDLAGKLERMASALRNFSATHPAPEETK